MTSVAIGTISPKDRFVTSPRVRRFFYVRSTGLDTNDGSQPTQGAGSIGPLATTTEAFRRVALAEDGRETVIDITGLTETITRAQPPPPYVAADETDLTFSPDPEFSQFFTRPSLLIRAVPSLVFTPTIIGTVVDPITGMVTYQTSDTFTVDQHKGRFFVGTGLAEYSVIQSNTTSDLVIANANASFTAPAIYDPGATLNWGDPTAFFLPGFTIKGVAADVHLTGIEFTSPSGFFASLTVATSVRLTADLCVFEGIQLRNGSQSTFDACRIHTGDLAQFGGALTLRSSFVHDLSFRFGGAGQTGFDFHGANFYENVALGVGHGGGDQAAGSFEIEGCEILDAPGPGILYNGGSVFRVRDCVIRNSAGDAIEANHPGYLRVLGVTGSGNGGFGINIKNGTHVEVNSATAVTGTSGNVSLGSVGLKSYPITNEVDLATLSRIFTP